MPGLIESRGLNFAGSLVQGLGYRSRLADARTGKIFCGLAIADLIAGFAKGFNSAGLKKGDRVVIRCNLTPASALAYLGALYAGLVAVPVDERAFSTICRRKERYE